MTDPAKTPAVPVFQGAAGTVGTTFRLELPWETPPLSLNDRHGHWYVQARAVANVREAAGWVANQARMGSHDRVRVTLNYQPLDKRRRDEDNLVATLKPCCDALVDAGLVPDDTPRHMVKEMPIIHEPDGVRRNLWLDIEVLTDSPAAGGSQPKPTAGDLIDWKQIAVKLGQRESDWRLLSTEEAEALRPLVDAVWDREAIAEDSRFERTHEAATGLEGR